MPVGSSLERLAQALTCRRADTAQPKYLHNAGGEEFIRPVSPAVISTGRWLTPQMLSPSCRGLSLHVGSGSQTWVVGMWTESERCEHLQETVSSRSWVFICLTEQEGLISLKALCFSYLLSLWVYLWISMLFLCTLEFIPVFPPLFPSTPPHTLPSTSRPEETPLWGKSLVCLYQDVHTCTHLCQPLCAAASCMSYSINFWSFELGFHILFWDANTQPEFQGCKALCGAHGDLK